MQMINRIIRKTVNSITYGTHLQEVPTQQKYCKLGIIQVKELFHFVVSTQRYFISDIKVPVHKSVTLTKTERYIELHVFINHDTKNQEMLRPLSI